VNEQRSNCSEDRLRSLLQSDDYLGDENQLAAQHIAECPNCQARLEELAAEPDAWSDARESLLSDNAQNVGQQAAMSGRPWARHLWQHHTAAWNESMSRQLLSPPLHPEMLGRIGRYEVERLIGAGGMGVVFKAFDTELNRPVAVKVLAPFLAGSGAARQRFAREARAAAAVVHEHVVSIHNVETDGESPFLVMHYVAGESLQGRIDREGSLDVCEILRIGMQTAAGLAAAHAQGLVHRDVKPSNILLEKGIERALLTDFGLARASDDASLTHTGYHPGTPQYMSPEQARGDGVDSRSDLFSLGSVIYAMCTGRAPFRAETSYGILRRITDTQPRSIREINPNIPEWLESIVGKLHAKSLEDRFASADEVHELLEQCLAHVQQPTTTQLPEVVAELAKSFGPRCRPKSAESLGVFRYPPISKLVAAAFAFSLIFAGVLIFGGHRFFASNKPSIPAPVVEPSAAVVSTSDSSSNNPETDWKSTTQDIESYRTDLGLFETRSKQLWDENPMLPKE